MLLKKSVAVIIRCGIRGLGKMAENSRDPRLIAVCQMTSTHDKDQNIQTCKELIAKAAGFKACMVFLPECFDYVGRSKEESLSLASRPGDGFLEGLARVAQEHNCWLSLGGFHEWGSEEGRMYNTHAILSSDGEVVSRYRKAHLFDLDIPGRIRLKESEFTIPGSRIEPPVDTPVGKIGLSTCYDMRFPEQAVLLRQAGAQILTYPSAFTIPTGSAHWESLLRARAIEQQCWVVAAAQAGVHNAKRSSYGHAMVVDPWGGLAAQCPKEEVTFCLARVDLDLLTSVRHNLPCAQHRRKDIYCLIDLAISPEPCSVDYEFGHVSIPAEQVFLQSPHSFAFVNIKPVVPGHVLVSPKKAHERLTDLEPAEVADMFNMAQRIQGQLERHYDVTSTTMALQDGPDAGQTVRHVHIHILPRRKSDFPENDQLYAQLAQHDKKENERPPRSNEEMAKEAADLRLLFT